MRPVAVILAALHFLIVASPPLVLAQNGTGYLRLKLLRQSGATVFLDGGVERTDAPADEDIILTLASGRHTVRVTKEGYADEVREVVITRDQVTKLAIEFRSVSDIMLKPGEEGAALQGYGSLTVLSDPPGATILLDDRPFEGARTPDTFQKVPAGYLRVGVEYQGKSDSKVIRVEKDATTKISFDLNPKFGHLTVLSTPSGLPVEINRTRRGTTPLTEQLEIGPYSVSVTHSSSALFAETLQDQVEAVVEQNKTAKLEFSLPIPTGFLKIMGDPPRTQFILSRFGHSGDGVPFSGLTEVKAGRYQLNFEPPTDEWVALETDLRISRGDTVQVTALLPRTLLAFQVRPEDLGLSYKETILNHPTKEPLEVTVFVPPGWSFDTNHFIVWSLIGMGGGYLMSTVDDSNRGSGLSSNQLGAIFAGVGFGIGLIMGVIGDRDEGHYKEAQEAIAWNEELARELDAMNQQIEDHNRQVDEQVQQATAAQKEQKERELQEFNKLRGVSVTGGSQ